VVFEAGLFGGALGIRRTFILHANGSKLPSDLLGLTAVRRLASSRPLRPPGAGRRQRGGAGPAHRAAPPGVEVGRERILSTDRVACTIGSASIAVARPII
jgi:Predicted nucleotide-binding protein containing TIR-like domain